MSEQFPISSEFRNKCEFAHKNFVVTTPTYSGAISVAEGFSHVPLHECLG